jgi:hypothetical protein
MGTKLRKVTLSVLLAGLAAVLVASPAGANRGDNPSTTTTTEPSYVPPYGQNPHPDLPDEPDPYANPGDAPTVVPVDLPTVVNPGPGAGLAGGGEPHDPVTGPDISGGSDRQPNAKAPSNDGFLGGVLSRTGAESLPLARAGLGALALGIGLVVLARRRRRSDIASA